MIELCPGEHWQWDQFSPIYTKYIHEEHPVSPVGCVALSTGMVMLYCKDGITIHNEKFDFENIRKTYYVHTTYQAELDTTPKGPIIEPIYNSTNSSNLGDRFPNDKFIYSLETNDRIAKLLYYIGKDLNLKYDELTYGYASDVIPYLKSLDYNVTTTFLKYDIVDIARHIRQKNIVYIYGSGHAWIIDGCCFNYISENKDDIEDIFIRCNWGSDPKYNGYYCGDVFMMYWCDFNPYEYFVIGKSRTSNI